MDIAAVLPELPKGTFGEFEEDVDDDNCRRAASVRAVLPLLVPLLLLPQNGDAKARTEPARAERAAGWWRKKSARCLTKGFPIGGV